MSELNYQAFLILAEKSANTIPVGTGFPLNFAVSGTNGPSFEAPIPVQINFMDSTLPQFSTPPQALEVYDLYMDNNQMSGTLGCTTGSIIYWVIGLESGIQNEMLTTIKAVVESDTNGLQ
jgi:hypothetical protein